MTAPVTDTERLQRIEAKLDQLLEFRDLLVKLASPWMARKTRFRKAHFELDLHGDTDVRD